MASEVRSARATISAAWSEATANRAGLASQLTIMLLNDAVWVVFWAFLFDRVGEVRGWTVDLVIVLFAVFATSAGIVMGLLGNTRRIGELAANGGLDAVLALPVHPLTHLLSRRVEAIFIGDIGFGLLLFFTLGEPTIARTVVFVFGVMCSTLVLSGFLVLVGSLSFMSSRDDAADLGMHAMLAFSNYPVDLFGGALRVVLYGVVPAAFVTSVPAKLIDDFSIGTAALLGSVALIVAGLGAATFTYGLRRYTSGATWTAA